MLARECEGIAGIGEAVAEHYDAVERTVRAVGGGPARREGDECEKDRDEPGLRACKVNSHVCPPPGEYLLAKVQATLPKRRCNVNPDQGVEPQAKKRASIGRPF